MRKQKLKKLIAVVTAAGLAAASATAAFADTEGTTNVVVSGSESKPVDGDVANHDATYGIEMKDSDDGRLSGTAFVNGSVSTDDTESTPEYGYSDVEGVVIDSSKGGKGTVVVAGDVNANAGHEDSYNMATGIYTNTNANITIGGDVNANSTDYSTGINYTYPGQTSLSYSVVTNVRGDVTSTATANGSTAVGMRIQDGSSDKTTIGGDLKASGDRAQGILITSPDNAGSGKTSEVTVGGNVEAEGTTSGVGIYLYNNTKNVDITVEGDIKGSSNAIIVNNNTADVNITTDGTISSTNGAAIAVVATVKESAEDGQDTDKTESSGNVIPEITVWKIESGSGNLVSAKATNDETKSAELKNEVLSSINYIIKGSVTENGKETKNGTLKLKGTSGTVTVGDNVYQTAHQDETLTINVETVDGYRYSLSDTQGLLTKNSDGTYTLKVPAGGGVDLKAVLEKIEEQEDEPKDDTTDDSTEEPKEDIKEDTNKNTSVVVSSGSGRRSNSNVTSTAVIYAGETAKSSGSDNWSNDGIGWRLRLTDGSEAYDGWYQTQWKGQTNWYNFSTAGYANGGWINDKDGQRYYLHNVHDGDFGYMLMGWHQIDGAWYFFNDGSVTGLSLGALLKSASTPDGHTVDANGVRIS